MKKILVFGFLALVLIGGGCTHKEQSNQQDSTPEIDRDAILYEAQQNGLIMTEEERAQMGVTEALTDSSARIPTTIDTYLSREVIGWMSGALADVTGGGGYGIAHMQFDKGTLTMIAKVGGLPEPAQGYSYQGWLVKRGEDLSYVNTGRVIQTTTGYANVYHSSLDLSDYGFYVLTLEPDDGNLVPGEHILEGMIN